MDIVNLWVYLQQKIFGHPFSSHLSTNKQWLAGFEILHISSTFTNITMPFMKSSSKKSAIINFAILWNVWFSNIFCKIHWSNVFSTFDMPFSNQNITFFASSLLRTTNSFFCLHKEVAFVTIGNPAFCLFWYLIGVHFWGELQHVGDVSEHRIKCRPIRTREIVGVRLYDRLYVVTVVIFAASITSASLTC